MKSRIISVLCVAVLLVVSMPIDAAAAPTVNWILPYQVRDARMIRVVNEGLMVVEKDGKYGYMDINGTIVIDCKYDYAEPFYNGIACVRVGEGYYYMDKTEKALSIAFPGEYATTVVNDMVLVRTERKYGVYTMSGQVVLPCIYDDVVKYPTKSEYLYYTYIYEEGYNPHTTANGPHKVGLLGPDGKEILPCVYDEVYAAHEGFVIVENEGQFAIFTEKGACLVPFGKYSQVGNFTADGFACVQKRNRQGTYIDTEGNEVLSSHDWVFSFSEGMSAVIDGDYFIDASDNVWAYGTLGFIDITGELVIPCEYDFSFGFQEGLCAVAKDGKLGFIDKTGNVVIPFIYDITRGPSFNNGVAIVRKDGKLGAISKSGEELIKFGEFSYIQDVDSNGYVVVDNKDSTASALMDIRTGKILLPFELSEGVKGGIWQFSGDTYVVCNVNLDDSSFYKSIRYIYNAMTGESILPGGSTWCQTVDSFNGMFVVEQEWHDAAGALCGAFGVFDINNRTWLFPCEYWYIDFAQAQGIMIVNKDGDTWGTLDFRAEAVPVTSTILVDENEVKMDAYNIDGNTYFKLRDIGLLLKETPKQFDVTYDEADNLITLWKGNPYTGTETYFSTHNITSAQKAVSSKQGVDVCDSLDRFGFSLGNNGNSIYTHTVEYSIEGCDWTELVDDTVSFSKYSDYGKARVNITMYNINGSNYCKLRDLGKYLGFGVGWDGKNILIDTTKNWCDVK